MTHDAMKLCPAGKSISLSRPLHPHLTKQQDLPPSWGARFIQSADHVLAEHNIIQAICVAKVERTDRVYLNMVLVQLDPSLQSAAPLCPQQTDDRVPDHPGRVGSIDEKCSAGQRADQGVGAHLENHLGGFHLAAADRVAGRV